jgi:hypothetical protein
MVRNGFESPAARIVGLEGYLLDIEKFGVLP